jgi:hypothetical protein
MKVTHYSTCICVVSPLQPTIIQVVKTRYTKDCNARSLNSSIVFLPGYATPILYAGGIGLKTA